MLEPLKKPVTAERSFVTKTPGEMIKNKRKYRRVEASIRVSFRTREELAVEYTKNISKGGIFLKTDQLVDPNADIDLTMTLPEGLGEFRVRGKVVRLMSVSHPDGTGQQLHGIGIRFVEPPAEFLRGVEQVVKGTSPKDGLKDK